MAAEYRIPTLFGFVAGAGTTPATVGTSPGFGTCVLTQIDAYGIFLLPGNHQVLEIDIGTGSTIPSLRLVGVGDDALLQWEAHWTGVWVIGNGELITAHDANPIGPGGMQVQVSGYVYVVGD